MQRYFRIPGIRYLIKNIRFAPVASKIVIKSVLNRLKPRRK